MAESVRELQWQDLLNIFTQEIQGTYTADWSKFCSLNSETELITFIYNFAPIRKRINAWLTRHPRPAPANCSTKRSDTDAAAPDGPAGNIREAVKLTRGENPDVPGASAVLQLKEDAEKGRYIIATEDITPGDTLFVEDPFTSVLCNTEESHCDFCCLPLPANPAVCTRCQHTRFCSTLCLTEAAVLHHGAECGSRLAPQVGIARLGLRVALVAEALGSLEGSAHSVDPRRASHQQQYTRVASLLTHLEDLTPPDKLQYTLTSVMLAMEQARARGMQGSAQRGQLVLGLGPTVLRHVAQMVCNGNAITTYLVGSREGDDGPVVQERQMRVATAIFPSASMMNHSCDPNILTSYVGRTLIARATRTIKAGEEVFNCYGPHFASTRTAERKKELSQQYFFQCCCRPCSEPLDFLEVEGIEALLCPACGGPAVDQGGGSPKCLTCQQPMTKQQLFELRETHRRAADILSEGDEYASAEEWVAAAESVRQGLELQLKFLHPHNRRIAQTRDFMAMLLARQGRFGESLEQLEASLSLAERWHGASSVEVTGLLDTMVDVAAEQLAHLTGTHWHSKRSLALEWCTRAQELVALLLGPWHPRMFSLRTSQHHLESLQGPPP